MYSRNERWEGQGSMRKRGLFVVAFLTLGCERSAVSGFEEIKQAACEGDAARVFERIDAKSLRHSFQKRVSESTEPEMKEAAQALAGAAFEEVITEIRADIAKGKASALCIAKIEEEGSGGDTVFWTTPSGKSKVGRFEKRDGVGWVMISMDNAE